jgi:hypothetical protein
MDPSGASRPRCFIRPPTAVGLGASSQTSPIRTRKPARSARVWRVRPRSWAGRQRDVHTVESDARWRQDLGVDAHSSHESFCRSGQLCRVDRLGDHQPIRLPQFQDQLLYEHRSFPDRGQRRPLAAGVYFAHAPTESSVCCLSLGIRLPRNRRVLPPSERTGRTIRSK